MKASIIITTFNRPKLLKFGLSSIFKNKLEDIEIIVLNDGEENDGTKEVCELFNVKYYASNRSVKDWRIPGPAINFGVKQSVGKYIFLSCAEMYHVDNVIYDMIDIIEKTNKSLVIPVAKDDNGSFLSKIESGVITNDVDFNSLPNLDNVHLPFFMCMNKKDFIDIGGYDSDLNLGYGYDDNDIVDRMLYVGNSYKKVHSRIVHLYHKRLSFHMPEVDKKFKRNESIYRSKKGNPIRNIGIDWGSEF